MKLDFNKYAFRAFTTFARSEERISGFIVGKKAINLNSGGNIRIKCLGLDGKIYYPKINQLICYMMF